MTDTKTDQDPKLQVSDLHATLTDERHHGFGYAGAQYLPPATRQELDEAILEHANANGLIYEDLFIWADSKYARWAVDSIDGKTRAIDVVRRYLTDAIISELFREAEVR